MKIKLPITAQWIHSQARVLLEHKFWPLRKDICRDTAAGAVVGAGLVARLKGQGRAALPG